MLNYQVIEKCKKEIRSYFASHFVARKRNEEEVSEMRIEGEESTLSDVLEEVAFTCVLAGEFPRRVEIGIRISVRVHEHLELLLHLLVITSESLRGVKHIRRRRIEV